MLKVHLVKDEKVKPQQVEVRSYKPERPTIFFRQSRKTSDNLNPAQCRLCDLTKCIGRDYHTDENVIGYYNAGDRMKYWGKLGAFWGGFWGLLFGSAFF